MNLFVFFVIFVASFYSHKHIGHCNQHNQNNYPAFVYDFSKAYIYFDEIEASVLWTERNIYFDGTKSVARFTACPASTQQEKTLNDRVSITGNSLFLRNVHGPEENITLNICDEPVEPTMLYNTKSHMYEIGYELFYEKDKFKWKDGTNTYHLYRPVNITSNNEVIDIDANKKLHILNDISPKLIFHWISVLSVTSSGNNKQIRLHLHGATVDDYVVDDDSLLQKCEDYKSSQIDVKICISSEVDDNLSTEQSKNTTLANAKKKKSWNIQSYGSLVLSQIIPLWYFDKSWAKAASCSHINMIPVWKSIADGQLRKVDLYIQAIIRRMSKFREPGGTKWNIQKIFFGANDVLQLKNRTDIDSVKRQKLYSLTNNTHHLHIPKVLYRVIEAEYYNVSYIAIIVIHNDPNPIPNNDRICLELEEVDGWEAIKNNDPRTGLTYVCHYNYTLKREENDKLGFQAEKSEETNAFKLDNLPYISHERFEGIDYFDMTYNLKYNFKKLLEKTDVRE